MPEVGETCEHPKGPRAPLCRRCYTLRWAQQNRAKCNAAGDKYRLKDPERWKRIKREYRERNRERLRAEDRKKQRRRKGVLEVTDELREGVCAVCERYKKKLYLDHDHTNGKTRGWICNTCNAGIGGLGDTAEAVRKALRYLEDYESKKENL